MPRFFTPIALAPGARVVLPDDVAHHAIRVLRLRQGDALVLFNGTGGEYAATLEILPHGTAQALLSHHDPREAELPFRVCIAQGLSAAEKMDWTLEKAIELGAHSVQPLTMQRSVTRLSADRAHKREAHWRHIARAASEQCGRNRVAEILPLGELEAWLAQLAPEGMKLLLDPDADVALARVPAPGAGVLVYLLAGPEGGLSAAEKAAALAAGFRAVSLGPRVLRTETAAAAALATLAAVWDAAPPAAAR